MNQLRDPKDFNRLVLCMQLTTSDNDGEALSAVRKANAILKRNEMRWDEWLPKLRPNGRAPHSETALDREKLDWLTALCARGRNAECINSKSTQFLEETAARLARFGHSTRISEKQMAWLEAIDSILSDHGL